MGEMKHTLGPYSTDWGGSYGKTAIKTDIAYPTLSVSRPTTVAQCHLPLGDDGNYDIPQAEANAELIALADTAPHECTPECPGEMNRRRLVAAEGLLEAARALMIWHNHHLPDCMLCGAQGLAADHGFGCPVALAAEALANHHNNVSGISIGD